jgi:Zn-dependent protease
MTTPAASGGSRAHAGGAREPAPFRIAGFPIHVSATAYLIFGFFGYLAATRLLPAAAPGATSGAYWVAGVVAAALFFASLLAHELNHALLARRYGVQVDGVTFWLFGGLARLRGDAPTPRAEWRIAAIGPATNLVFAGLGALANLALTAVSAPALVVAVAGYFTGVNLLLGVFNLLPAAPLDGGRIVRAFLWRRWGDRTRATVAAANAGRLIAMLVIALGAAQFFLAAQIGGLWTGLIGVFLFTSAGAEARTTVTRTALEGLRVRDLVPIDPIDPVDAGNAGNAGTAARAAAPAWYTVTAFLDEYRRTADTRTVVPLRGFDGGPAGLVSLAQLSAVPVDRRDEVRVAAVAAPLEQVTVADPDDLVLDLLPRLASSARSRAALQLAGHALVVHDGQPVAVLTPADLARAVQLGALRAPAAPEPNRHLVP